MGPTTGPNGAPAAGWAPPPEVPAFTPPPPRPPRAADPAPAVLLTLALVAGVALDLGVRGGFANLAVALGLAVVVAGLASNRRLHRRSALALALAALVPLLFLVLRTSWWLTATNLALAGGLVLVAIAYGRSGRPTDTTLGRLVRRSLRTIPSAVTAPAALRPLVPRMSSARSERLGRVAVALAVSVPVLVLVTVLLAMADPVFAGMLTPDLALGPLVGHALVVLVFALGAVCVIGAAAADTEDHPPAGRFGKLEVVTMLGGTAVVLGLFVVSQLLALTSAGERLVEQAGLTPAEYARSGFFQLCWATGLILTLLAATRALAAPGVAAARGVRALGALVPILALGLVAVSLRRMALYDDAFGLTMLRLWVLGTAVWMGVVLVLVALRNAGVGARREWVLAASLAAAFVLVVGADVANPEAYVARHNLARAERGAELDPAYLAQLSDDAVPTIADAWDRADDAGRLALQPALRCGEDTDGVARLNVGAQRATEARSTRCAPTDGG